jgi:UDP-N-acetylglucosamine 2-epimerase (non-hydrolysing)
MVSSLAAFYAGVPIAHVEAGIRTFDMSAPFPEEANRQIISTLSTFNFAPTKDNVRNLLHDGISRSKIFLTGNTVTDSLRIIKEKIDSNQVKIDLDIKTKVEKCLENKKKIILFTMHRRESFGKSIKAVFESIKKYALDNKNVEIFYPVHPNPNVKKALQECSLDMIENINLLSAVAYQDLVFLLHSCDLVVTDSGGIQEEATSLGKHSIILRERTDRPESVIAGFSDIVGCDRLALYLSLDTFLYGSHQKMYSNTLFGDGFAAQKIAKILTQRDLGQLSYRDDIVSLR